MSLFTSPQTLQEGELWDKTKRLVKNKSKTALKKIGHHIMANKGKYAAIAGGISAYALRNRINQPFAYAAKKAHMKSNKKWADFQKAYANPKSTDKQLRKPYNSSYKYASLSNTAKTIGKTGRAIAKYGGPAAAIGGIAALADKYIPLRKKKETTSREDINAI